MLYYSTLVFERTAAGTIVDVENLLLVTAHPEFLETAVTELRQLDKQLVRMEDITPDIALCHTGNVAGLMQRAAREKPIFVRHLAPVQAMVDLSNTERDFGVLATTIARLPMFALLERGIHFAVQSRFAQTERGAGERPYSTGQLNRLLAEAFAEETGARESIKKPQVVVSILCTPQKGYLGISSAEENLSSWPGGARHFAHVPEEISRAEFKLLEALEVFDVTLPGEGQVLDLGAAPGGWTRLLLEAGLHVIAVDPARLDTRLARSKHLEHYPGYAENYLEEARKKHRQFDVIVNDMRMDAREAARILNRAADSLRGNGFVISVLKLPHATREINPLATLKESLSILHKRYGIVQARQLFHNRQEVTVFAAHPLRNLHHPGG
jgi:23S rRNA (cytidine2498-2'-O)-methyltransferase